jgi:cytochrome oxidase Cu insertion factor (SCO1/SenC/PrrC family)
MRNIKIVQWIALLALAVTACTAIPATGGQTDAKDEMMAEPTSTSVMMEEATHPADDMMESGTATPDAMADPMMDKGTSTPDSMQESNMMDAPAWFTAELTDVSTGETFSIADYKGKVVLVEMMAQWCPTCLSQAKQVTELHSMLGESAEFVSVSLDIDPNEDAATLKTYVERNGFSWMFAVAPAEVSREIGNLYGSQYLNPPSAPILLVDRDGNTHLLDYGLKSAEELKEAIEPLLNGGM